jgi:hypothetical protein
MMKRVVVIIGCLTLSSCATLGTHQEVANRSAMESVKTIAIGPYRFNAAATEVIDVVYPAFDTTLLAGLRQSGAFVRVVPWDSLKTGSTGDPDSLFPQLCDRAQRENLDAILMCDLSLVKFSYMFIPMYDAEVSMHLYRSKDRSLIMKSTFSTKYGSSYFWPPTRPTITRDATVTAVEALLKCMKRTN